MRNAGSDDQRTLGLGGATLIGVGAIVGDTVLKIANETSCPLLMISRSN